MELFFCGVRGSTPAGAAYVRYGGHTSGVALAHDGAVPSLVLDGGTGLANLDRVLGEAAFDGTILLGHLHWDHTHGLPFFMAGARPGHRVLVLEGFSVLARDTAGVGLLHGAAVELAAGVDLLIHDAQYTADELPRLAYLGHSCPEYAIALAEAAGARQVCLFHHAPQRTDDEIDEIVGRLRSGPVPLLIASDSLTVRLAAQYG